MIDPETLRNTAQAATLATELAACVALGAWIGQSIDTAIGSTPIVTLVGVAGGLGLGVFVVLRTLRAFEPPAG